MHKHLLCLAVCKKFPNTSCSNQLAFAGIVKEQCPDKQRYETRRKRRKFNGSQDRSDFIKREARPDQDDVRHARVRPGGGGARGRRGIRDFPRLKTCREPDLQEDVSLPPPFIVKHLFPDQFLFRSSLNHPLFIVA